MTGATESEAILQTAKRLFLIRSPEERLLLSIIDANPGPKTDVHGATWLRTREIRLKKAMRALCGRGVGAKGQQPTGDQRALYWMASERHRDRFYKQVSSGSHPFFKPGSPSHKLYLEKIGKFKFRSDRTLAEQAAERFFGPFTKYEYKQTPFERLRNKWGKQRGFWNWNVLYNDDIEESIENRKLERCRALLRKRGIRTVRNDLAGMPAKKASLNGR